MSGPDHPLQAPLDKLDRAIRAHVDLLEGAVLDVRNKLVALTADKLTLEEGLKQMRRSRDEGAGLLRRAAGSITTYQCEAMVLDGDADEEDLHAGDDILAAIGEYLARVGP